MAVYKDNATGTWRVIYRFTNWKGERKQTQKRGFATLKVFSAYLHMDEATPHLHIDFIPYVTGSKRGLETRVSLKKALEALGFKGGTRSETERNQWYAHEKEQLSELMLNHGIEWEKKGTHEKHLSVLDFKKQERSKEVEELEKKKTELQSENQSYEEINENLKGQLSELDDEIRSMQNGMEKSKKEAESARKQADKYQNHQRSCRTIRTGKDRYFSGGARGYEA